MGSVMPLCWLPAREFVNGCFTTDDKDLSLTGHKGPQAFCSTYIYGLVVRV